MTEDERRERIEATASWMIAELLERAANGEALPVQGAFVVRIRAPWPKRLATRTPSPSRRATWPCSRTWPRRWVLASAAAAIDGAAAASAGSSA